jgi:hypothetical protein
MSNPTVDYDSSVTFMRSDIAEVPGTARRMLVVGGIPANFVETSRASKNYRDAVLADILVNVEPGSLSSANVLDALRDGVRSSQDGSIDLQVYTEYLAALAFAWGDTELAGAVIMRSKPEYAAVSTHTMSIVSAITKQMPSPFYLSLLVSQGPTAASEWLQEQSSHFPQ